MTGNTQSPTAADTAPTTTAPEPFGKMEAGVVDTPDYPGFSRKRHNTDKQNSLVWMGEKGDTGNRVAVVIEWDAELGKYALEAHPVDGPGSDGLIPARDVIGTYKRERDVARNAQELLQKLATGEKFAVKE